MDIAKQQAAARLERVQHVITELANLLKEGVGEKRLISEFLKRSPELGGLALQQMHHRVVVRTATPPCESVSVPVIVREPTLMETATEAELTSKPHNANVRDRPE